MELDINKMLVRKQNQTKNRSDNSFFGKSLNKSIEVEFPESRSEIVNLKKVC